LLKATLPSQINLSENEMYPTPVEREGPGGVGVEKAWLLLETEEGGSRGADTGTVGGGLDGFGAGGSGGGGSRDAGCTVM
jgi:hypothetical protein